MGGKIIILRNFRLKIYFLYESSIEVFVLFKELSFAITGNNLSKKYKAKFGSTFSNLNILIQIFRVQNKCPQNKKKLFHSSGSSKGYLRLFAGAHDTEAVFKFLENRSSAKYSHCWGLCSANMSRASSMVNHFRLRPMEIESSHSSSSLVTIRLNYKGC